MSTKTPNGTNGVNGASQHPWTPPAPRRQSTFDYDAFLRQHAEFMGSADRVAARKVAMKADIESFLDRLGKKYGGNYEGLRELGHALEGYAQIMLSDAYRQEKKKRTSP
jgi:hypothetical protein